MKQVSENSIDWSSISMSTYVADLDSQIDSVNYELESEHMMEPWLRDELIAERDHLTGLRDAAQNAIDAYGLQ
jgi:hypothetical protein